MLDNLAKKLNNPIVARAGDIIRRIRAALATDGKRLQEIAAEMDKLAESYHRYLALQRETEAHEKSACGLIALLGHDAFYSVMQEDKTAAIGEQVETVPKPQELRDQAALWEHVYNYLRFVHEVQIKELLDFFEWVGIKTSRQAIESSIHTHSRMFIVRKKGREKFVSLKNQKGLL